MPGVGSRRSPGRHVERLSLSCGASLLFTDLPDRQFFKQRVQPLLQKYSDFPETQITLYPRRPVPQRGRFEIVTDAGQDAVDASGAKDEGAFLADGEVVWSCSPVLFSSAKDRRKRIRTNRL